MTSSCLVCRLQFSSKGGVSPEAGSTIGRTLDGLMLSGNGDPYQ